ncbi:SIS domain-containing protein [Actinoplanes sp. NPDC051470]|uniref:SIS domain-containing protein n=1 Tax=unclassified Actinoplanes TaxID=2626549 RepID=UPI003444CD12
MTTYAQVAQRTLTHVLSAQTPAINAAAALIVGCYRDDGILQTFGTGHARIIAHEMAGRAGGLVPVNMLSIKDLVMFGGTPPGDIMDPTLERDPTLAGRIYTLAGPGPGDVFLLASNCGINGSIVEMASLVTGRGHPLIAITSLAHTNSVPSRHHSGKRLADLADVVVDTGAPPGDAAVELADGTRVGAVSSLAGVLIAQLLTEEVSRRLLADGTTPPIYTSMNLPDGDERNAGLTRAYGGRVRVIEP